MNALLAVVFVAVAWGAGAAQPLVAGQAPTTQSASGQFVVFAPRYAPRGALVANLSTNAGFIALEPTLLVISCERIRQKLWAELSIMPPWRGRVSIHLYPARSGDDLVAVVTEKSPGAWNYRLEMPDTLSRERFVRAIVQVLLLEIAQRNSGGRSVEIPLWLVEGLAADLRATSETELLLPPPSLNVRGLSLAPPVSQEARWVNPLQGARQELLTRPALTFDQLSWPTEGQLAGDQGPVYRYSSQLFVASLLRLPNGPACLRTLLAQLSRYYNWQLAFFSAFRPLFRSPLDVEKWWALQVVQFTGRDLSQTWTLDDSLKKLDEILPSRVEVRSVQNELPLRSEVNFQTIIREWPPERQREMLQRKLGELDALRLRVAPAAVAMVDDYRHVLLTYLQKRFSPGPLALFRRRSGSNVDRASRDAIAQLDVLDRQRHALQAPARAALPADRPPPAAK
jgi:hypothetical protein